MNKEVLQEVLGDLLHVTDKLTKALSLFRGITLSEIRPPAGQFHAIKGVAVWEPEHVSLLAAIMEKILGYPAQHAEGGALYVVQAFNSIFHVMSRYWVKNSRELTGSHVGGEVRRCNLARLKYAIGKVEEAFTSI